jgi:predicted TIM-barrel fold metal-dependent hydrolase
MGGGALPAGADAEIEHVRMTRRPTLVDEAVPDVWHALGLPGLVDVHVHFMPDRVLAKVWAYFDGAESRLGRPWPIAYRVGEGERLATLRALGVRAFPSLVYPHKPGMAEWLNTWAAAFADRVPDCVRTATFYPEPSAARYVADAIAGGARLFKAHVQVGDYDPRDPLLDPVWQQLADSGVPLILHAGSGPMPGRFTGPAAVADVLRRHPRLTLVIAHMGVPEYAEFVELAERHPGVYLDTTMAFTDYVEGISPYPRELLPRLAALRTKVLLGSDFPNIPYPYAHQIEALLRLGLGNDWLRAVLWDNAVRLLGLPL